MSMKEYLFKEISPEYSDFSTFFDDDGYNERGGDYCYTIFVIGERGFCGVNAAEYDTLKNEFNNICSELSDIGSEYSYYKSVKELMIDYKLHYTPRAAHELKMIVNADYNGADYTDTLPRYLTLKTGRNWDTYTARGYCQGDYCEIIFCNDQYSKKDIEIIGDIYNGCGKEFCMIELDTDGNETDDTCYGFIIADCQISSDKDYKTILADYIGIKPELIDVQLISNSYTTRHFDYITV